MITIRTAARVAAACACAGTMAVLAGCGTSTGNAGGGTGATTSKAASTGTAAAGGAAAGGTGGVNGGAATGGSGGGATDAAAGGGGGSLPRCHTSDLAGSFKVVAGSAGAGNIVYNIDLTNTSSHPCTVYGYAGMRLLNASKGALPTTVQRDTLVAKTYVTLIPNGDASASARFSPDVPGPGEPTTGACEPTAAYTEITPPDETTHLTVPVNTPTPVCEHGTLQVSAFVKGTTGPGES